MGEFKHPFNPIFLPPWQGKGKIGTLPALALRLTERDRCASIFAAENGVGTVLSADSGHDRDSDAEL